MADANTPTVNVANTTAANVTAKPLAEAPRPAALNETRTLLKESAKPVAKKPVHADPYRDNPDTNRNPDGTKKVHYPIVHNGKL